MNNTSARSSLINREWTFFRDKFNMYNYENPEGGSHRVVNLPHDFMIEGDVVADAVSGSAMGFYEGGLGCYTKQLYIPEEYKDELIYLYFDGVMGQTAVEVNGAFVKNHHYGYTPFFADITPYVDYGAYNRVTVDVNANMQPSSRWYSGAGIYRDVRLIHVPKLHIKGNGIYVYTQRISYKDGKADKAFIVAEVEVCNHTDRRRIARVDVTAAYKSAACKNDTSKNAAETVVTRSGDICVEANSTAAARIRMTIDNPRLWDDIMPDLYDINVNMTEVGVFSTHLIEADNPMHDEDSTVFGIRTITADSTNGLLINNRPVKLKGGCVHHDNGILGAVSLYDSEYRKLRIHKESGYNAIRSAHNPPSTELLKACDELGIYVIDEAFDCFEAAKLSGDYSVFFKDCWKEDIEAFMKRDRNHPSVIIWSTGNEITERGGLGNGFTLANELASHMRQIDSTRLVTNAFCSFWSGLCDNEQKDNPSDKDPEFMERRSEPFVNNLDIVGYNYLDDKYCNTVKNYPERVLVGTESFPRMFDTIWANVMKYPAVIGDFTWTSYDYIGEAGIGKSFFYNKEDEEAKKKAEYMVTTFASEFPWRLAKDADFDINGNITPQGCFRRVVWGSTDTYLFSAAPDKYDMEEKVSLWGFDYIYPDWSWNGFEGKNIKVKVFSRADEVVLYLNDVEVGRKKCGSESHFTADFDITYNQGTLTAVSLDKNGQEISGASLSTTKKPCRIELKADKKELKTDGSSLAYIEALLVDEVGRLVQNMDTLMSAEVTGAATLAGFGSANPVTDENYTTGTFTSYRGKCMAVIRSGYEAGIATLTVRAKGYEDVSLDIHIV